jgi:hypothetical protein
MAGGTDWEIFDVQKKSGNACLAADGTSALPFSARRGGGC